ncbi:hypothetical protein [Streptomyces sp. NPDC002580]|uniref:hypothetical protein n=1 Tax=Streptomyces sp. NPDC002580 TaxID=3364653 RepID=UPI00367CF8B2
MSTERPDNDAPEPVEGHAEGPVEGAAERAGDGPAGGPVPGPAEDAGDGRDETAAPERSEEPGPVGNAADDPAPSPGQETAEASAGIRADETAEAVAGGDAEESPDGADGTRSEGPVDAGSGGSAGETAAGEAAEPLETAAGTPSEGPSEGPRGARSEGPGESRSQDPAGTRSEGRATEPVAATDAVTVDEPFVEPDAVTVHEPVVDSAPGGVRRRGTPAVVASVVAAVLLVGGGGAFVATNASGGGRSGTPGAEGTPPVLALDGYSESTAGAGSTGGAVGIAPGEPDPYGTTYRADGELPAGPDSAHVQWAEGRVTRAEVARLAKALHLAGTPRLTGDAWTVGAVKDGSEPNLRVNADAPGTWTFSASVPGSDNCVKGKACGASGFSFSGGTLADPVSEAAARKAAAPVLKAAGQDDAKVDASQLMNDVRVVNADPVVDGLPTYGWTTGLRIGADGRLLGGSGQLKVPVRGETYPVIGARQTLDRMNGSASVSDGGRMGIGGCASPVPLKDRDEAPCEHPTTAPGPKEPSTVEKATFGLVAHRADGRQALVPSWLFEVREPGADDTYTVTHPAVDPKFLASTAPSAQPTPTPTAPAVEPSGSGATKGVQVMTYTADGKDLKVSFVGGVCADYSASASESAGKVTVTITTKPWKQKVCILMAKLYERTVHLDRPLDGRKVVGQDGEAIQEGLSALTELTPDATPDGSR